MNRRVKIVLVFVLLLVFGSVLVFLLGQRSQREVDAYKKQLLAKGELFDIHALAPPQTNDANFARSFNTLMGGYRLPTNRPPSSRMVAPGVAVSGASNVPEWQMAGYDKNAALLATVRELLGTNELGFNLDYSIGAGLPLPHLARVRYVELLAEGTVTQALATNDFPAAREALLTAVDFLRASRDEPLVISQIVRAANEANAQNATWELLQDARWTDAQLAELQAKWEGVDFFSEAAASLRMERAIENQALAESRKSFTNMWNVAQMFGMNLRAPSTGNALMDFLQEVYVRFPGYWKWRSTWSYQEELYLLKTTDAALDAAGQIKKTDAFAPALRALDQQLTNLDRGLSNRFKLPPSASGVAPIQNSLKKLAAAENGRRLTVAAIALKRYYLAHGAYPKLLAELVPQFIIKEPIDFMDGRPIRYRLQTDGNFVMYVLGEDGVDHGGSGSSEVQWPRLATPEEAQDYFKRVDSLTNSLNKAR